MENKVEFKLTPGSMIAVPFVRDKSYQISMAGVGAYIRYTGTKPDEIFEMEYGELSEFGSCDGPGRLVTFRSDLVGIDIDLIANTQQDIFEDKHPGLRIQVSFDIIKHTHLKGTAELVYVHEPNSDKHVYR